MLACNPSGLTQMNFNQVMHAQVYASRYNTGTFALLTAVTDWHAGVSSMTPPVIFGTHVTFRDVGTLTTQGFVVCSTSLIAKTKYCVFDQGSRFSSLIYVDNVVALSGGSMRSSTGYANFRTGGFGVNAVYQLSGVICAWYSSAHITGNALIENCFGHAIEAQQGFINFNGVVRGCKNTGAGFYCWQNSTAKTVPGSPPTVTGLMGDVTFDNVNPGTTWLAVESAPVVDLTQLSILQKASYYY
jgi:hypothetical protein